MLRQSMAWMVAELMEAEESGCAGQGLTKLTTEATRLVEAVEKFRSRVRRQNSLRAQGRRRCLLRVVGELLEQHPTA
jgi:hypothetical protein